jgi:uncharacterized protein YkwD
VLGLTVTGLLAALGAGAALMPDSVTGKGVANEKANAAGLAPKAAPAGDPYLDPSAGASPTPSASPSSEAPSPAPSPSPAQPTSEAPKPPPKKEEPPKPPAPPKKSKEKITSPPNVGSDFESQENEVVRLANIERGKAGCGELRSDDRLRTAMRLHVQELGTRGGLYISHDSFDGRSFVDRAKAQQYNAPGGENVARGQSDAADAMNSWMNSDGHRKNILNCSFKAIGVGAAKGVDGTIVWGQIFGRE